MPFENLKNILRGGNLLSISLLENGIPMPMYYFPNPVWRPGIISSLNEDGNLGFAGGWISQDMADFHGDPKKLYTIECSVIRPIDELRSTHPILIVGLDRLEGLSRAVDSFVLFAAASVCFVFSAVFGAVFFYLRHRARRKSALVSASTGSPR